MIIKTFPITIILFMSTYSLWGQMESFAPFGANWFYRPHELMPNESTLYTFNVSKDTVLDGVLAKELSCAQWINGHFQYFPDLNQYVHAGADSVFYYVENHWALLFNFAALPGDTISSSVTHFNIFNGCLAPDTSEMWSFSYRIDSVAVENIGGNTLRVQYVSDICPGVNDHCWTMGYPGKIVERIGAINAGYWWGQGQPCILGGFPGYLRCYQDAEVTYKGNIGNTDCDFVGNKELYEVGVSIFPNPTDGIFNLTFSPRPTPMTFRVYDSLGCLHKSGTLAEGCSMLTIDIQNVPADILFFELASEANYKTFKILKK